MEMKAMSHVMNPITRENFPDVWKQIAGKRRRALRKYAIRRAAVTLAQLLYFILFLILAFGVFYEMGGPLVRSYLDQIPELGTCWNTAASMLFEGAETELQRLGRCAVMLYALPFCAAVSAAVLILVVYHPRTPKRTGDEKQDAWQLCAMAKHAKIYAEKPENNTAAVCAAFVGVFMAVFVLGLLLFAYTKPELHAQVMAEAHLANLRCFLYGVVMFICCRVLNVPLKLLLKLLHGCHVNESMLKEAEAFHASFDE